MTSYWTRRAVLSVLILTSMMLAGCERATDTANPEDAAQVARGGEVYAVHCAGCHGAKLEGQPNWRKRADDGRLPAPPHDDSGHTWHHPDAQLFELTKRGPAGLVPGYESDMPAFRETLSDQEIDAVLSFIKSTWPERERNYQARITQQSQQLVTP